MKTSFFQIFFEVQVISANKMLPFNNNACSNRLICDMDFCTTKYELTLTKIYLLCWNFLSGGILRNRECARWGSRSES